MFLFFCFFYFKKKRKEIKNKDSLMSLPLGSAIFVVVFFKKKKKFVHNPCSFSFAVVLCVCVYYFFFLVPFIWFWLRLSWSTIPKHYEHLTRVIVSNSPMRSCNTLLPFLWFVPILCTFERHLLQSQRRLVD